MLNVMYMCITLLCSFTNEVNAAVTSEVVKTVANENYSVAMVRST